MADAASVYTNEKDLIGFDSKGESFPLDFNLKDVIYTIEVEISAGKHNI